MKLTILPNLIRAPRGHWWYFVSLCWYGTSLVPVGHEEINSILVDDGDGDGGGGSDRAGGGTSMSVVSIAAGGGGWGDASLGGHGGCGVTLVLVLVVGLLVALMMEVFTWRIILLFLLYWSQCFLNNCVFTKEHMFVVK